MDQAMQKWNFMTGSWGCRWRWALTLCGCLTMLVGCAPQAPPTYTARQASDAVLDKHAQQVQRVLTEYYGNPRYPRLMVPEIVEIEPDVAENLAQVARNAGMTIDQPSDIQVVLRQNPELEQTQLQHGQQVYHVNCAGCHGVTGDGEGEAAEYLFPRPRDYRLGRFKFTSTPRGEKPRRVDLERIILHGATGTSMPAFRWLPPEDLQPLIDYVILLSKRGELEIRLLEEAEFELYEEDSLDATNGNMYADVVADYATAIDASWARADTELIRPLTQRPLYTDDSILDGRRAYLTAGCAKCHGVDGRGTPPGETVGMDDWGHTAYAADLSAGMLHGGRRPIDIYRRIYAGINGTPMPAFAGAVTENPEVIWQLVHYVLSIVERREVVGLELIEPPPPAGTEQAATQ